MYLSLFTFTLRLTPALLQLLQSAAALNTVIDEFNHLNFKKVLERCASACHSPCMPLWGSPGIRYDSVSGTEVSSPDHHTVHLLGESCSGFWAVGCSLTFQGCLSTQTGLWSKKATVSLAALTLYLSSRTKLMTVCHTNRVKIGTLGEMTKDLIVVRVASTLLRDIKRS